MKLCFYWLLPLLMFCYFKLSSLVYFFFHSFCSADIQVAWTAIVVVAFTTTAAFFLFNLLAIQKENSFPTQTRLSSKIVQAMNEHFNSKPNFELLIKMIIVNLAYVMKYVICSDKKLQKNSIPFRCNVILRDNVRESEKDQQQQPANEYYELKINRNERLLWLTATVAIFRDIAQIDMFRNVWTVLMCDLVTYWRW